MGKPNRDILTGGKRYAQKKAKINRVEEVTFDKDARHEFLTGFHKRKLMRKKKAQEFHAEQDKIARLEERKNIRESRKDMIQKRLAEINEAKHTFLSSGDESEEDDDDESSVTDTETGTKSTKGDGEEEEDDGEWSGFKDDREEADSQESKNNKKHGILKVKQVYDIKDTESPVSGESVVTIESMDNPNASYIQNIDLMTIAKANHVDLNKSQEVLDKSIERAKKYARLVGVDSEPKPVKQKKKKFRYLSKTERKMKNLKEKKSKYKSRNRE